MFLIPKTYLNLLKKRDFLLLTSIIFVGQLATAFLMLSLVVSVFLETGSDFGVSGVIISFTIPGFLLMAVAGLAADIVDRKKIIVLANCAILLVVFLILFLQKAILASIPLSFLYFAGNSFFLPAASAASAQLVKRTQLLSANAVFIFTMSTGIILGLFLAAIIHFFFGIHVMLVICEILLVVAAIMSFWLPKLFPRKATGRSILKTLEDIWGAFVYISHQKVIWFFFVIFALLPGIISFGVTIAPGFFDEIVGLSIDKSPIFILPLVGVGVLLGVVFLHNFHLKESLLISFGLAVLGLAVIVLASILRFEVLAERNLLAPVAIFLVMMGFGVIIPMVASRAALQKRVAHHFQGTVFGANIILASFLGSAMSPLAAGVAALLGYVNLLALAGAGFLIVALAVLYFATEWKF